MHKQIYDLQNVMYIRYYFFMIKILDVIGNNHQVLRISFVGKISFDQDPYHWKSGIY